MLFSCPKLETPESEVLLPSFHNDFCCIDSKTRKLTKKGIQITKKPQYMDTKSDLHMTIICPRCTYMGIL